MAGEAPRAVCSREEGVPWVLPRGVTERGVWGLLTWVSSRSSSTDVRSLGRRLEVVAAAVVAVAWGALGVPAPEPTQCRKEP